MAITTDQVKVTRQRLDKLEKGIDKLGFNSREVSLCKTSLQRSRMFLGLVLKDMDAPNPYPESMNKDSKTIEPLADQSPMDYNYDATDHIGKVKELRNDFELSVENVSLLYKEAMGTTLNENRIHLFPTHLITSITALEEAKMWLGMELGRIRDGEKGR